MRKDVPRIGVDIDRPGRGGTVVDLNEVCFEGTAARGASTVLKEIKANNPAVFRLRIETVLGPEL